VVAAVQGGLVEDPPAKRQYEVTHYWKRRCWRRWSSHACWPRHTLLEWITCPAWANEREREYEFLAGDLCDTSVVKQSMAPISLTAFTTCALVYGVSVFHEKSPPAHRGNNLITHQPPKYGHDHVKRFVYLSSSMVTNVRTIHTREQGPMVCRDAHRLWSLEIYWRTASSSPTKTAIGVSYVIWRPFSTLLLLLKNRRRRVQPRFYDMMRKFLFAIVPSAGAGGWRADSLLHYIRRG